MTMRFVEYAIQVTDVGTGTSVRCCRGSQAHRRSDGFKPPWVVESTSIDPLRACDVVRGWVELRPVDLRWVRSLGRREAERVDRCRASPGLGPELRSEMSAFYMTNCPTPRKATAIRSRRCPHPRGRYQSRLLPKLCLDRVLLGVHRRHRDH